MGENKLQEEAHEALEKEGLDPNETIEITKGEISNIVAITMKHLGEKILQKNNELADVTKEYVAGEFQAEFDNFSKMEDQIRDLKTEVGKLDVQLKKMAKILDEHADTISVLSNG